MIKTTTTLLPHQQDAATKMRPLKAGALYMDMRTGKSRTAMEIMKGRLNRGKASRCVWTAPCSTLHNLARQWELHTTGAKVCIVDDKINVHNVPDADVYLVGLQGISGSMRVDEVFQKLARDAFLVVDESDFIKNPKARRSQRVEDASKISNYKLLLTGTPIGNGIEDLYQQFRVLSPNILGYNSYNQFEANHVEYSADYPRRIIRRKNIPWVTAMIAPYVYQVQLDEVVDLPQGTHKQRAFELSDEQQAAYDRWKEVVIDQMLNEENHRSRDDFSLFYRLISGLQRITCGVDPENNRPFEEQPRAEFLLELVDKEINGPVVVWCRYQHCIDAIIEAFGGRACGMDGRVPPNQREAILDRHRAGGFQVLAVNTKVGAWGLDMSHCATAVYYSYDWSYTAHEQSMARIRAMVTHTAPTWYTLEANRRTRSHWGYDTMDARILTSLGRKQGAFNYLREQVEEMKKMRKKQAKKKQRELAA